MSDTDQQVSLEQLLEWELEIYLRSCFLYYHSDLEPVLSDAVHDMGEQFLQRYFEKLPEWFKAQVPDGNIKPHAHALSIPEDVKTRAIEWHKQCKKPTPITYHMENNEQTICPR